MRTTSPRSGAPLAGSSTAGPARVLRREALAAAAGSLALVIVLSAVWLGLWVLLPALLPGWSAQVVVSDSMAPAIRRGDIVVASPADPAQLGPPDVIVHRHATAGDLVTHRIVEVTADGDLVTRGDANGVTDARPVAPEQVTGVGRVLVPMVGLPAVWWNEGEQLRVALVLVAGGMLLSACRLEAGGGCGRRRSAAVTPAPAGERPRRADRRATSRGLPTASVTVLAVLGAAAPWAATLPEATQARFSSATAIPASWTTGDWLGWWDGAYARRRPLTVTTGPTAPHGGYAGYTVRAVLDTEALIAAGTLRADCADLRVVRAEGSGWSELDRIVEGCGTAATEVWFALADDLADGATDTSTWLYHDHAEAGPGPADPGAVYLAHDDFEAQTPGQAPAGWSASGEVAWGVPEAGLLRAAPPTGGNNNGGGNNGTNGGGQPSGGGGTVTGLLVREGLAERDVLVEARVSGALDADAAACTVTRVAGGDHLRGCVRRDGGQHTDAIERVAGGQASVLAEAPSTWDDAAWQHLALATTGDARRLDRDGATVLETSDPSSLDAGGAGLGVVLRKEHVDVDEIRIRRLAPVEPTVEVGAAELQP